MRDAALWLAIAVFLIVAIGFSWTPTPFTQLLVAIFIACAFVHACATYGARSALVMVAICVAITVAIENIGVATGFPFGRYHFEVGGDLPHVGAIPIIVGPLWFGAGYFSWIVAAILLDGADERLDRSFDFFALPVVAAFVMTQWDVVMDPPESTIGKAWIWHDGGADFGVPLTNFVGWLLTAWLFYLAFALYLRRRQSGSPAVGKASRGCRGDLQGGDRDGERRRLRLIAVLFYAGAGLTHVVPWLIGTPRARWPMFRPRLANPRSARGHGHRDVVHDVLHLAAGDAAAFQPRSLTDLPLPTPQPRQPRPAARRQWSMISIKE